MITPNTKGMVRFIDLPGTRISIVEPVVVDDDMIFLPGCVVTILKVEGNQLQCECLKHIFYDSGHILKKGSIIF